MLAIVILGYISSVSLFLFFVFMLVFYDWRWIKDRHRYAKIPSPKWHFIAGAGIDVLRCKEEELFNYLDRRKKEVKSDIMLAPVLGRTNVLLFSPEDIEELFKSFDYVTKGFEYSMLKTWFHNNVTVKAGHDWLKRRKLLTPGYHSVVLQNYLPALNKNAKLLTKIVADQSKLKGCINIEDYTMKCSLDNVLETMVGLQLNCLEEDKIPDYAVAMNRAGDLILKRILSFWLHNETFFNMSPTGREFYREIGKIHVFCAKLLKEKKLNRETNGYKSSEGTAKSYKSFLDYMLTIQKDDPTKLSDEDIIGELQSVLLGGTESVALCLTYTIFLLAMNPEVQRRLQEEIDDIFDGSDREVTAEDLNKLNYTDMVISESLRLYPVFPLISRMLETDLKLKKYTIPAGTNIMVFSYTIHRDPDLYPDPEKFDPDRFLPEAVQSRNNYAFLGWSAGYRNCMGKKFAIWSIKIMLATMFRRLTVSTRMKREDLIVAPQFELKPMTHVLVTFEPKST